jgi:transcriptional regulator with XRE-family HTH domain
MTTNSQYLSEVLCKLASFRENLGISPEEVEDQLMIGRGWIKDIEDGVIHPSLDLISSILSIYGKGLADLSSDSTLSVPRIKRSISAYHHTSPDDLTIFFDYGVHNARYLLSGALEGQFNDVVYVLRNGLASLSKGSISSEEEKAIKSTSVASSFLRAVSIWQHANPSDIWWFIIYRLYCDQYNHPSLCSKLDFQQSWKRTGGWALEQILVHHYQEFLAKNGVRIFIGTTQEKDLLLKSINSEGRLESDKADVLLTYFDDNNNECFAGVVHVKASFAERRTDDVPMSKSLSDAGFLSPLWTMDCKSTPSPQPMNRGELGKVYSGSGTDERSAKRKDIEEDGFFTGCFSYNSNTLETPELFPAKSRIYRCNFTNPDDSFSRHILDWCHRAKTKKVL